MAPTLGFRIILPIHAIVLCQLLQIIPHSLYCKYPFLLAHTILAKGNYGVLWWCTWCDPWSLLLFVCSSTFLLLSSLQRMRSTTKDIILLAACGSNILGVLHIVGSYWSLHCSEMPKATRLLGIAISPKAPPVESLNWIVETNLFLLDCMCQLPCTWHAQNKYFNWDIVLTKGYGHHSSHGGLVPNTEAYPTRFTQTMMARQMSGGVMSSC